MKADRVIEQVQPASVHSSMLCTVKAYLGQLESLHSMATVPTLRGFEQTMHRGPGQPLMCLHCYSHSVHTIKFALMFSPYIVLSVQLHVHVHLHVHMHAHAHNYNYTAHVHTLAEKWMHNLPKFRAQLYTHAHV